MSIEALEKQVIKWAEDRGIFEDSTHLKRGEKFLEEIGEFLDAAWPEGGGEKDMDEVKLEAGDVLATLINILHPMGLDLETCLAAAYEKIKDRKGRMINGTFVKQEDI